MSGCSAMIFTGVHVEGGKTTRWKVENSWGERAGIGVSLSPYISYDESGGIRGVLTSGGSSQGFFTMSDEWFSVSSTTSLDARLHSRY